MNRELWQRIGRLENWIRQEGKRTNTCTRQILNEVCEDCRCHRNKRVPPVIKARTEPTVASNE